MTFDVVEQALKDNIAALKEQNAMLACVRVSQLFALDKARAELQSEQAEPLASELQESSESAP